MTDCATSSQSAESQISSSASLSTLLGTTTTASVSRRRLAFRPQSIKVTGKPYRNSSINEAGLSSFSGTIDTFSSDASASRQAPDDALSRISSPSFSNPPMEVLMGSSGNVSTSISSTALHNTKARRRLVTNWTFKETLIFYDGLKQYGKDFDSIAKFMAKKKFSKDKDQIRNYYFNAFKIWKLKAHIEESDWGGVPRDARELFVVLNGCEWRKKTVGANFDSSRFRALILDGTTSVRIKKKLVSIRTPYCACLLKFFPYDKRNAEIPTHLCLKFTPYRYVDRNYVLSCEQNPLLQVRSNINDKIANIFTLLEKKWNAPLNRLATDPLENTDSLSSCGSALRLRVNNNVQIHKVEVQLNDCPAMSLNKLKRDYDDATGIGVGRSDPAQDLRTDSDLHDAPSMSFSCTKTSFGAFSSADENSNETPSKNKSNGKLKDWNIIKIGQTAANVFEVDEVKLKEGLTHESVGNATLLQLFYLCGMIREIPITYELIDIPPNIDLSWKMFVSLVSRDYGEMTAKAIQRNSDQQQHQQQIAASATVNNRQSGVFGSTNVAVSTSMARPLTTSTCINTAHFGTPKDHLIGLSETVQTAPVISSSCSIGDFLGVTRRRSRRKVFNASANVDSSAANDDRISIPVTRPTAAVTSGSVPGSNVVSQVEKRPIDVSSRIVEAENAQFLQQLREINQPVRKRAKRQVKVVPNNFNRSAQMQPSSSGRSVTFAPMTNSIGKSSSTASNMVRLVELDNSAASIVGANATPLSIVDGGGSGVIVNSLHNNTVTYMLAPMQNAVEPTSTCFSEGNQPIVLDESQLSSILAQQGLGDGKPVIAYLSNTGQLVGVNSNTTYVAVNLKVNETSVSYTLAADNPQQQFSNLTECTEEIQNVSSTRRPTDFSHMATTSACNSSVAASTSFMSILDTSPTDALRPMSSMAVNAAFRSPTKSGRGYRFVRQQFTSQSQLQSARSLNCSRDVRTHSRVNSAAGDGVLHGTVDESVNGSLCGDFSMDSLMFSGFNGSNSYMTVGGTSNSAHATARANLSGVSSSATSFVLLDASPSSKTLPEDVRHAYELMLKENSVDYCRNFAQLTRNMDLIQADNNNTVAMTVSGGSDGPASQADVDSNVSRTPAFDVEPRKRVRNIKHGHPIAPKKD